MTYLHWLIALSIVFALLERLIPARPEQPRLRPGLPRDLGFLAFNGHLFSLLTATASGWLALHATRMLGDAGLRLPTSPLPGWPLPAQVVVFLLVSDFLQWCVHNLLHRVPFLWALHKVHHSITAMDWIGNFRFHWFESVVYKSLQWLPLALLGASETAVFIVAVVSTAWGDFNHSNIDVDLRQAGYVFNSPRMHLWHHDASSEGGVAKNFGITLSLWDHLFGTAYWPRDRGPAHLGYPGMEEMPQTLAGQILWPLTRRA